MPGTWMEWIERLPLARSRPAVGYIVGVMACGVSLGLRLLADPMLPPGYPFVTFFPAVIIVAFLFGARPGLLTAILGWLAAQYFFMPPYHDIRVDGDLVIPLLFYAFVVLTGIAVIHLMQRANAALGKERQQSMKQNERRALLFAELQHRISNKLQIIASLLTLQRRQVRDPAARKMLEDAAMRVGLIGRISRTLHHPDQAGLGVGPLLEQIGWDIIEAAGSDRVRLQVAADPDVTLPDDAAVPIALIIAESVSNALEHAFDADGGVIAIDVRREGTSELVVSVSDDGRGLPDSFDASVSPSLGLRIATTLAQQLNGRYELCRRPDGGALAVLRIRA